MAHKDILIKVDGLWKKYCRDLKTSLLYALRDIGKECLCLHSTGLGLREKEFWSLKDINFELSRGETLGIMGPNGAGKSTLLKLLNGIIKPSRGRITVDGSMEALIELGGAFNPILSGRENILVSAAVLGIKKKDLMPRIGEIIEFAELQECIDSPVATYSTGMKVRLGFSVATLIQPEILILDEVLSVGDIAFQMRSLDRVALIREKAGAVIFVSHNVNHLRRLCTKCLLLDRGEMLLYGEPDMVIDAYIKAQNLIIAGSKTKHDTGLVEADGVRLIGWGLEQEGAPAHGEISKGPFKIWYRIILHSAFNNLSMEMHLKTEAMESLISQTFDCGILEGATGAYIISVEFPDLHLSPRHYFPYIALVENKTLKKLIRFQDHIGFTIKGEGSAQGYLNPALKACISREKGLKSHAAWTD